jgi:hypothetical protein
MPRTGKSTLVKSLIPKMKRKIILDPMAEYGEYGATIRSVRAWIDFWNAAGNSEHLSAVVQTSFAEGLDKAVFAVLDPRKELARDLWLVIEEISLWSQGRNLVKELAKIYALAGHTGLSLMAVSQFPSQVGIEVTAFAGTVIAFQTTEPAHQKNLSDRGLSGVDLGKLVPGQYAQRGELSLLKAA